LGDKPSVCSNVIERLYSTSGEFNEAGQYIYYASNEDGAKHCAMNILYSLQHLDYLIPPQADRKMILVIEIQLS